MIRHLKALLLLALVPSLCLLAAPSMPQSNAADPTPANNLQDAYYVWYKPATPGQKTQYTVSKQCPPGYFYHFGPASFRTCGAQMKALGVPGWEKY